MNNRVTFEIVGIGKRMSGVSKKNNKPYDFIPVSLLYESPGFTGRAGVTLNLNAEQVAAIKDFCVGGIFDAVVYFDSFRRMNLAYIF